MNHGKTITALVFGAAAIALIPASAQGAQKFGADLEGGPQPANAALDCDDSGLDGAEQCTRVAYNFNEAGPINGNSKAPKDGKIDRLKLIAQQPGKFTFQLARIKNLDAGDGTGKAKITRSGGKIEYDASDNMKRGAGYNIQTFNVDVAVKKGEYMAFKAKEFSAQTCSTGSERELVFQPPPAVGGSFQNADASEDCTILVQAVYK